MRWLPRTLFGRLILLLALGLVTAQLAGTAIHLAERQRSVELTVSHELAQRLAAIHRAIDDQRAADRSPLAARLSTPRLSLTIEPAVPLALPDTALQMKFPARLREQLGPGVEMRAIALPRLGDFSYDLYLKISPGEWLRVRGSAPQEYFAQPWHVLINLAVMLLAIVVFVALAARIMVRPLTELARAARGLGEDIKRPPLPENGPSEVREAARAFNAMQTRIRAGIEERERFLAAVSHDLKTPVTRLRLRSEMLVDPELRNRFRHDVNEMQQLLDDALDFLRGKTVDEPVQPIDLIALVESVVDDFTDMGNVTLETPPTLRFSGRPKALRRALSNLIDNALKYGGDAKVEMTSSPGVVQVSVEDKGSGLTEEELERVFEPFYRVESSRNRETGGTGLGLAIVRQVAMSHGGDVSLTNRPQGGLRATLRLPVAS